MKKAIRLFCAFAMLVSASCGQQNNKTAEGAVDAETVIVNRVKETRNQNGETEYIGEVALVQNPGSQEDLEEMAKNDEFDFLSEEELKAAGITFSKEESEAAALTQTIVWWPILAGIGVFLFGRATAFNEVRRNNYYNSCNSCYSGVSYQSRPLQPYAQVVNETPIYAQVGVKQDVLTTQYSYWR